MLDDTIAAISTPIGAAGIGIVRISGSEAVFIADKVFRGKNNRRLKDSRNYSLNYGYIVDDSGQAVDEVLVSVMRGPHSFTAENVVEINSHGGLVAVRKTLETVLKAGARHAEPGEFSKRAFLNGRIDLAQAESIIDLINAKTEKSLNVAFNQLEGVLSGEIKQLRAELLDILAFIEAGIDFPEHDLEEITVTRIKEGSFKVAERIKKLIASADTGKVFRDGLKTLIVGKPNVGKSSLLNALLREKRAIVTDIPGTTRDVIEEIVNIKGIPLKLVDTAGIRETEDVVERIGVEKTREAIAGADLVLMMIDAFTGITPEDKEIFPLLEGKNRVVILNKIDLGTDRGITEIREISGEKDILEMSLVHGKGLDELEKRIEEMVYEGVSTGQDDVIITGIRHKEALEKAARSMKQVLEAIQAHLPLDCLAIDLKEAWEALGEIIGETVSEDLVEHIFTRFCIGK